MCLDIERRDHCTLSTNTLPMIELLHVDLALRGWIVHHRLHLLSGALWGLSAIGRGGIVWMLIAALLTAAKRLRPEGIVVLALGLVVTSAMNDGLIQPLVARDRPFHLVTDVPVIGSRPDSGSFPSGHTANAFAGAAVLSALAEAPALPWWILAGMIAYSRVYLGVHYPSDVVAGALLGVACAIATLAIARRRAWM
jgi:undecaprenyl-diphosphatase